MQESPLLKIYASTQRLILYKRTIFNNISISIPISPLQYTPKTSSSKIYICLHKLVSQVHNYCQSLSTHHKFEYHLQDIKSITQKLKTNRDLINKQQSIFEKIQFLIDKWQQSKDPLIYYNIGQRQQLKQKINIHLLQLQNCYKKNHELKKPFYLRKLKHDLRYNLLNFSKQQIQYNNYQLQYYKQIILKVMKLISKIMKTISNLPNQQLINQEKTQILKKYIDIFSSNKQTQKEIQNYHYDLVKCYKNMIRIIQIQKDNLNHLINFINHMIQGTMVSIKKLQDMQDRFRHQVKGINDQIFNIVAFQDILPIINNFKNFIQYHQQLKQLRDHIQPKIEQLNQNLDIIHNIIYQINNKTRVSSSSLSNNSNSNTTSNYVKSHAIQQFLADKKVMQFMAKKQKAFQDYLLQTLAVFLRKYQVKLSQLNIKSNRLQTSQSIQVEKSLDLLFINYFQELETLYKSQNNHQNNNDNDRLNDGHNAKNKYKTAESSINLRQFNNNNTKMNKIFSFLNNLKIFNQRIDISDSFNCSLGPKLLLNGQLKTLTNGIYFQSNFNKKNIFFGNTRIFIPKQQIYQINKQKYLLLSISVQLTTKNGIIFFNSINSRDNIYDELISFYLPQIGINHNKQQIKFGIFKGNQKQLINKIGPFLKNYNNFICSGIIPSVNLAHFFHRYFASQQFLYQGKKYKHFKQFSCQLAGGTDIKYNNFTPGIPSYFRPITTETSINNIDSQFIQQSSRLLTYNKSIPYIPFLSQGGQSLCSQKNIYRWGGPKCFVIDINTIISGFPLLQGMIVKVRQIFEEKDNNVCYRMSSDIQFQISKATNSLLRSPTLSQTKDFVCQIAQKLTKIQKSRNVKKDKQQKKVVQGMNKGQMDDKNDHDTKQYQLVCLNAQVKRWRSLLKWGSLIFALIYMITLYLVLQ